MNRFDKIQRVLAVRLEDPEIKKALGSKYKEIRELLLTPITSNEVLYRCMRRKIWRLNFCYNIVNKRTEEVPFIMTAAQFKVYLTLLKHSRIINLKSRQQGISTLWLISFTDDCLFKSNVKSGMISIGNQQQQNLLDRANAVWEMIEPWAKTTFAVERVSRNRTKELGFSNNSQLIIGNSFRGQTLTNLHVSELGEIADKDHSKAIEIMEGSVQTVGEAGRVVIESTAKGENKFSSLYRDAELMLESGRTTFSIDEFYPVFLSWVDDPDCNSDVDIDETPLMKQYEATLNKQGIKLDKTQKNFWVAKYRSLGEGIFKEYPATVEDAFMVSTEGTILAKHYMEFAHRDEHLGPPHGDFNWRPDLPVYVSFDLGTSDPTFMIWMQVVENKLLIIREKMFKDEGLDTFSNYLNQYNAKNKYRDCDNEGYMYDSLIWPHDGDYKHMSNKTENRADMMRRKGWNVTISKSRRYEDIAMVKDIMQNIYIFPDRCPELHKAFLNYKKRFDKTNGRYEDKPQHDDFSHPIDSLRYGVTELYGKIKNSENKKSNTYDIPPV